MISADTKFAQAEVVVNGFNGDNGALWNFISGKDEKESGGFFSFFTNIFSKLFGGIEKGSAVEPLDAEHKRRHHGRNIGYHPYKGNRYHPRNN